MPCLNNALRPGLRQAVNAEGRNARIGCVLRTEHHHVSARTTIERRGCYSAPRKSGRPDMVAPKRTNLVP